MHFAFNLYLLFKLEDAQIFNQKGDKKIYSINQSKIRNLSAVCITFDVFASSVCGVFGIIVGRFLQLFIFSPPPSIDPDILCILLQNHHFWIVCTIVDMFEVNGSRIVWVVGVLLQANDDIQLHFSFDCSENVTFHILKKLAHNSTWCFFAKRDRKMLVCVCVFFILMLIKLCRSTIHLRSWG